MPVEASYAIPKPGKTEDPWVLSGVLATAEEVAASDATEVLLEG